MYDSIQQQVAELYNPDQAKIHKRYHKSDLQFNGLAVPVMRKIASGALKQISSAQELFVLFNELWKTRDFESRNIAVFMLMKRIKWLEEKQFDMFYPLFRDCDGWALTDYLGIKILGEFLRKYKIFHDQVDAWKDDDHLWVRRAGIIRFIAMAQNRDAWPWRMESIMEYHFSESDFFIRKALGWNLREWAKSEPEHVANYINFHKNVMSPLTIREGAKHLDLG